MLIKITIKKYSHIFISFKIILSKMFKQFILDYFF